MIGILKITDSYSIGRSNPCFVIAEIGQNHQGDINIAKQLITKAKECGADCVKFQKSVLSAKFTPDALSRSYTGLNSWGKTYGEHKIHLEFTTEQYKELQKHAEHTGILFTASAMDMVSLTELHNLKVPFIKIGSGDANNFILLEKAASLQIPLIISTGMQSMATVRNIYSTIKKEHNHFCLMQCTSAYPTAPTDVHLKVIESFHREFPDVNIGYSGHELGIFITASAVVMGAKVIERHLTLDKNLKGSDHICSLVPSELKDLIDLIRRIEQNKESPVNAHREIRSFDDIFKVLITGLSTCKTFNISEKKLSFLKESLTEFETYNNSFRGELERIFQHMNIIDDRDKQIVRELFCSKLALGNGEKKRLNCEMACFKKLGKSLVYKTDMKAGSKLTHDDIDVKVSEPRGISAEFINDFVGKTLKCDTYADNPIDSNDIHDINFLYIQY